MDIVYSDRYQVDIGAHVFHMGKYTRVRDGLLARGLAGPSSFVEPSPAGWDELALVHTREYLDKTRSGGFRASELALLELPWSTSVAEGFRLMAGGTIAAARLAVEAGARLAQDPGAAAPGARGLAASANLGGGFHHAFPSHGEGFCLYNDVAVAIRVLQRDGMIRRAAVVDADVHQGNGTAFIFDGDPSVFTFSIHAASAFPLRKEASSLDLALADRTGDEHYLAALATGLERALAAAGADLVLYVAGVDPYVGDQTGRLSLSRDGLARRDHLVLEACRRRSLPVAVTMAGGYSPRPAEVAELHLQTVVVAASLDGG